MKAVLLLNSHIGSGSNVLFDILAAHPRIDGFRTNMCYDHYDKLEALVSNPHKNKKSNSIWMDELLHNNSFSCKPLLKICKLVFMIREPRGTLAEILGGGIYDIERAARYYRYRLLGLCEYAVRSGGYVLTYDQFGDWSGLERYLGLKSGSLGVIAQAPAISPKVDLPYKILSECEQSYEQHLGHVTQLN